MDPVPLPPPTQNAPSPAPDLIDSGAVVLDVNQSMWKYLLRDHLAYTLVYIVLPIIFTAVLFIALLIETKGLLLGNATALVFIPLLITIGAFKSVHSKLEQAFFTQVADQMHLKYSAWADNPNSGQLFTFGDFRQSTNELSGTYSGARARLFDYKFTTGSGKSRQDHFYSVAEITVNGTLPELMIQPRTLFSFLSAIDGWKPRGTHELSLGAFDEKFITYVADGSEIETLQVLEPTVMLTLMDGFESFGLECTGSHVYIYRKGKIAENRDSITSLLKLLERLYTTLIPELQNVTTKVQTGISV